MAALSPSTAKDPFAGIPGVTVHGPNGEADPFASIPGVTIGNVPRGTTAVPSSSAPQSFALPPNSTPAGDAAFTAQQRAEASPHLPSFGERVTVGGSSGDILERNYNNAKKERAFVAANTSPDGVPLDINESAPAGTRFALSNKSRDEQFAALEAEGLKPRYSVDNQHIIIRTPDGKKDVLFSPQAGEDIAGNIAPALEGAGKMAAGTLVGNPELGMASRGAALLSVPATTLAAGGSGKQAALETALTAAPVLAAGTLGALGRRVAMGAKTPIETRGVPALSRLTGEAVPAEISTGRPFLARAANAPITGTFEKTGERIEGALGQRLGEKVPAIDYRKQIGDAFNEREAPIMELADSSAVKPSLDKSRAVLKELENRYGRIVKEGVSETGEQATEATARNAVISKLRDIQSRLEKTDNLSISNLLQNRRLIDDDIDFQNLTGHMDELLRDYRNALNADAVAGLQSIPKPAQAAYAAGAGEGLTPAESFLANNAEYSEALKPIELQKVVNSVRATPPKGIAPEDFNRVDYTSLNKKLGRSGGKIVDADARAKIGAQIGEEGVAFLEDLADASALLEKSGLAAGDAGESAGLGLARKTLTRGAIGAGLGGLAAGGHGASIGGAIGLGAEVVPALGRMATGAALRNPAVNKFLATGQLPSFVAPLTQAASATGAITPTLISTPAQTLPTSSPLGTPAKPLLSTRASR